MTRLGALLAMLAMLIAGCGRGDDDEAQSQTPRLTTVNSALTNESTRLLTEADVRAIPGLEGATATEISDVPLFENPDPRGPCGAVVPQLPLTGAIGRGFTASDVLVFEFVTVVTRSHEEYIAALRADVHPGCEPYQSRTNTGATRRVSEIAFLNLDDLGTPAIGWTSTNTVSGQSIKGGALALGAGERFAFVQFQGAKLPAAESLQRLVRQAVTRLKG